MTKVRSLHWSHIVIILVVDRLGQIYDNIHCHLMQNKALKPLAKPATEWVVELKGHRGGALCNEQLSLFRDSEPVSCVVLPKESTNRKRRDKKHQKRLCLLYADK